MIKTRIFSYELKRVIISKAYLFFLIVICVYSFYTLSTSVLRGFANTAPFSEWSFVNYLLMMTPLLSAVLLFYMSRLFSPYEKNAMRITSSTPFYGPNYFFIKIAVVMLAFILAALLAVAACLLFYATVFSYYDYTTHMVCLALVLLPQLLFLSGVGLWISRLHHNLVYALIALLLFISLAGVTMPYYLDILGSSILQIPYNSVPADGSIPFIIPADYLLSRVALCVCGLLLIVAGCRRYKTLKADFSGCIPLRSAKLAVRE